ncbi:sigma-70 family RNA polymerase sigma factor [Streptomyces sp. FXJ1.172]|uniref:sigma-70 family RNA polymerase sigma factor n=1 Tax=Streptomyces sp. FXJ1.172 TaxID=710705 RepID=UPI0007CF544A|nr:sigma-70 family RNA polymerase sigma factor [Streptomyces sp. FXJ1.172]WEO94289.1 sigma-70 family RNA polymerase sigma factor [Streptomyces sp. FXJ1.172]
MTSTRAKSSPTPSPRGDFTAYATEAWPRLLRTARLLTGDADEAADLARAALAQTYARRRRVPSGDADFYVRRTLVRLHRRHRSARGHRRLTALGQALADLPVRQRVVLVLRHGDGLAEAEIAELLGCSQGAVAAYARRGLAALSARALAEVRP